MAAMSKSASARLNLVTDALFDEIFQSAVLDGTAHLLIELGLTQGPLEVRLQRWLRKSMTYRG